MDQFFVVDEALPLGQTWATRMDLIRVRLGISAVYIPPFRKVIQKITEQLDGGVETVIRPWLSRLQTRENKSEAGKEARWYYEGFRTQDILLHFTQLWDSQRSAALTFFDAEDFNHAIVLNRTGFQIAPISSTLIHELFHLLFSLVVKEKLRMWILEKFSGSPMSELQDKVDLLVELYEEYYAHREEMRWVEEMEPQYFEILRSAAYSDVESIGHYSITRGNLPIDGLAIVFSQGHAILSRAARIEATHVQIDVPKTQDHVTRWVQTTGHEAKEHFIFERLLKFILEAYPQFKSLQSKEGIISSFGRPPDFHGIFGL